MSECDLPELERILDTSKGEREIAQFLKVSPRVLYWTICPASGHDRFVFAEFPLGSEFRCDFVVLNSYSGAWEVTFIELEPVDDPVVTKRGTPSKGIVTAAQQIDCWREYVERNFDSLRSELVRWAGKRDLLGYSDGEEPCNESGDRLADPKTVLLEDFLVVAGRSSRMDAKQRRAVGRTPKGHSFSLMTYDRILHLARKRYGASTNTDRRYEEPPI